MRAAELAVKAAQADVAAAELALDRTIIKAPFDGRVQQKRVDIGQFVGNGTPLAQIYALEALELRLPLSDAQLALLPEQLLTSSGGLVGSVPLFRSILVVEHGNFLLISSDLRLSLIAEVALRR